MAGRQRCRIVRQSRSRARGPPGLAGHLRARTVLGRRSHTPSAQQATEVSARRHYGLCSPGCRERDFGYDHSTSAVPRCKRPTQSASHGPEPQGEVKEMTVVQIIGWSVIAAAVSWQLAWRRARAMINHIATQAQVESQQLRAEVARWRAHAARLSKEIEAWKAGHLEGRADVVSIVPLLIAAQREKVACTCAASQIPSGS